MGSRPPELRRKTDVRRLRGPIIAVSVALLLLFGAVGVELQRASDVRDAKRDSRLNDVRSCARQNAVRRESNRRIEAHEKDKQALLDLLEALTTTRRIEASVYAVLAGAVPQFRGQLNELRAAYARAARLDAMIRRREQQVTFRPLVIVNCSRVVHPL